MSDLEIIKELEKQLGRTFKQVEAYDFSGSARYVIKDENVIWLNMYKIIFPKVIEIIVEFKHLIRLSLTGTIPENVYLLEQLNNLKWLNLSWNRLTDLTPLAGLKQLTELHLHNNQISDLSPLKELTQLNQLHLHNNQISDLSPLKELSQLTRLDLSSNHISNLSPLMTLTKLDRLDLKKNKIRQLPAAIVQLKIEWTWGGTGLSLSDNPLEHPPAEIVYKGRETVLKYFDELKKANKPLNEAKVILVGEGGSGKTSLMKRLRGEEFYEHESQTDGINIGGWSFTWQGKNIKIHLWDFGGQEIMRATHQFFLTKRSLYILVVDGRKDEKIENWLKLIESVGGDSPVLVVINKIDQNLGFEVNQKTLKRKYKNIKGFFRISCATGKGLGQFTFALKEQLTVVKMIHTAWPGSWFNIKTTLEKMNENFIPYETYKEICKAELIRDDSGQETLVEFLCDLGIILHFKELELQDTNVLNPKWVTEGVYKIINSNELATGKGILEVSKLERILKKGEEDGFVYPHGKCNYIVALMKKFELCFEIDKEHILVPDLLKVEESEFDFDFNFALSFVLDYDFLPYSVMPRFMVRMHNDIKGDLRWRTGVVLENIIFNTIALVSVDYEEKRLCIFVTGERKRDYFSVIRHTILEINNSFKKLHVVEKVPLPDDASITIEYEELAGLERMGTTEFDVGKLGKRFSVSRLLDGLEKPEDREQRLAQTFLKNGFTFSPVLIQKSTHISKQESNIAIDIDIDVNVELPSLQLDFSELKELLEEKDPKLEKQLEKIEDGLDGLTGKSSPQELAPPLNKMGRFLKRAAEPDSTLNKILSTTKKGIETAQKVGRTYNKFAQWLGMPQVPKPFLGEDN